MTVVRRRNQRRAAEAVQALQVGTGGQRHAQDLQVAARAGQQVRAVFQMILGVDVGAGGDQKAGHLHLMGVSGGQQCRAPLRVACLRRCACGQLAAHVGHVATRSGVDQRWRGLRLRLACRGGD
jgi:hypothetical protein